MAKDPEVIAHQQWIGYVQPVGLVVSIPALVQAQAYVNKNIAPDHQRFLACLPDEDNCPPAITDFARFTQDVFGWEPTDLIDFSRDGQDLQSLEVVLPEYNETLRPTHGVREYEPKDPSRPWMMLIQKLPVGQDLDKVAAEDDRYWQASPHDRFDRLLRKTEIPAGILFNGLELRLVYAPRGETSGYMTFRVKEMAEVAGRPIFAAMHMLLEAPRLFSMAEKQRLPAILADSRKYQNVVSTQLAEQVLAALYELLRGFQAADAQRHGDLLHEVLAQDPNHVYGGLLNVLMRLVFVLYAEDRGLMSSDPVYANFYSVTGLFERLRADAGRYPDTMDQRYGAWAQLLTLFRMVYEGGRHGGLRIPGRKGYLFDPDRYPFLEGRPWKSRYRADEKLDVPHISDGVIFRVLQNLLILEGERLSYRTLDVEQIGSVYEAVMGFYLEVADGRSIAIKPVKSHGAPATINLEALLAVKPADRVKSVTEQTDQKLTGQAAEEIKKAGTIEDLLSALDKKIARNVTPNVAPKGAMVLQPSDERRRSGSHYTPRSLTEPIVRTTLRPVLEKLSEKLSVVGCQLPEPGSLTTDNRQLTTFPTPEQILDLKVCDPAMGSGAFLVETCRQLGDELVKAWHLHNVMPKLPPDEDELLYARRMVAHRCLYGVDKNPMAVDLAKLSLWLATLAKDHPFTFLDHSLRQGDSLVGLTQGQIAGFHWSPSKQRDLFRNKIQETITRVTEFRRKILWAQDDVRYEHQRQQLDEADEQLSLTRLIGNSVIAAFFSADKDKQRQQKLDELEVKAAAYLSPTGKFEDRQPLARAEAKLLQGDRPVMPFHWQIEFPEVFLRDNGGFDAIVGNPPFMGGTRVSSAYGEGYRDWLKVTHEDSHGNADLVAHFFRRAFALLRTGGSFGLIATNTISQGDTRATALRWICGHSGVVYAATKRLKWPGQAAVTVSVVHILKADVGPPPILDGRRVDVITAYLFYRGGSDDPARLRANERMSFKGSEVYGMGFTFDDSGNDAANSISDMRRLLADDSHNAEVIFPYLGGDEVNDSPTHEHHRYVINFDTMSERESRRWPDVMRIVETRVKPQRDALPDNPSSRSRKANWWQFSRPTPELYNAIRGFSRVLVAPRTSKYLSFTFIPGNVIPSENLVVIASQTFGVFGTLHSRIHEAWVRFTSSTFEDRQGYRPTDCFETFPFPPGLPESAPGQPMATDNRQLTTIASAGHDYYNFRAALMVRNNEGLTKTYNRFHNPAETSPEILELRRLHDAMDHAVLDAYGWSDLKPTCEFLLDYEEDEEEDEFSPQASPKGRGRKKPWRYRWPDEVRDEVLARLLELNKQRAEEERLSGASVDAAKANTSAPPRRRASRNPRRDQGPELPGLTDS